MNPSLSRKPIAALALLGAAVCAQAALPVGAAAPDFTAQAALAGKEFTFSLKQALAKGPVVLYFYPKSFTSGCTAEAHDFAEASPQYQALGATVLGMSHDDIATQKDFSQRECRDQFAVAADADAAVLKRYDVGMMLMPNTAARVSFVISPQGKILYVYDSMNPDLHVSNTLKALQAWRDQGKTR
jgi:thioredoxin-dependent peroxiredoxin